MISLSRGASQGHKKNRLPRGSRSLKRLRVQRLVLRIRRCGRGRSRIAIEERGRIVHHAALAEAAARTIIAAASRECSDGKKSRSRNRQQHFLIHKNLPEILVLNVFYTRLEVKESTEGDERIVAIEDGMRTGEHFIAEGEFNRIAVVLLVTDAGGSRGGVRVGFENGVINLGFIRAIGKAEHEPVIGSFAEHEEVIRHGEFADDVRFDIDTDFEETFVDLGACGILIIAVKQDEREGVVRTDEHVSLLVAEDLAADVEIRSELGVRIGITYQYAMP